jgi:hypothetical protein
MQDVPVPAVGRRDAVTPVPPCTAGPAVHAPCCGADDAAAEEMLAGFGSIGP